MLGKRKLALPAYKFRGMSRAFKSFHDKQREVAPKTTIPAVPRDEVHERRVQRKAAKREAQQAERDTATRAEAKRVAERKAARRSKR